MMSWIVLGLVAAAAALAVRTVWRGHKAGKTCGCGGDCAHCKGCR